MMEELGLGTKATRPDIIQKLFDRGYVYNNPPEPSETGIAMYKAFKEHVLRMATPEMTAELERDMDEIAAGKTSRDDVLQISREMLHGTYDDLFERREDLAKVIWAGMDEDKFIGPCKVCEEAGRAHEDGAPNRLRIIEMRGGKRFVGCEGYNRDDPEDPKACHFSRPLPGPRLRALALRGALLGLRARRPRLKVKAFRGRPWNLCLNDDCPTMIEMREKRAERQKAKEEAEKRKGPRRRRRGPPPTRTAASPNGKKGKGGRKKAPKTTTRTKRARTTAIAAVRAAARLLDGGASVFVTLEGIDGAGKSTQARLLAEALGPETLLLREPGGTPVGERLRELLKDGSLELTPRAELMLFCAARAELVERVIQPALEAGRDVVCDRFVDSTVAYQGGARGLDPELVDALNAAAVDGCMPDRTVLLRVAVGEPRSPRPRSAAGPRTSDRFEREGPVFQERDRRRLRRIAAAEPERVVVVDAEGSVEEVHARVMEARAAR